MLYKAYLKNKAKSKFSSQSTGYYSVARFRRLYKPCKQSFSVKKMITKHSEQYSSVVEIMNIPIFSPSFKFFIIICYCHFPDLTYLKLVKVKRHHCIIAINGSLFTDNSYQFGKQKSNNLILLIFMYKSSLFLLMDL